MDWNRFWYTIKSWLTSTGIKILIAILVLIISFAIISGISRSIAKKGKKLEEKTNGKVNKTLYRTLSYVLKVILKILVVIAIVGYLGLDTSGISALIASLGVGVGLAVNGTLSNFAGGVLLLVTHPFKDDDYIEACGYSGTVEDIFICNTKIRTPDNKVVYLPNGKLSTTEIVNYTEKDMRRVDLSFSIAYSADFEKARKVILGVAAKDELILKTPETTVRMSEQGDSAIVLSAKCWCKTDDYWTVFFNMNEAVKKAFDENGIEIPFNQLDVHVKND